MTFKYHPYYIVETVTERICAITDFEKKQPPVLWGGFLSFVLVSFFSNSSVRRTCVMTRLVLSELAVGNF